MYETHFEILQQLEKGSKSTHELMKIINRSNTRIKHIIQDLINDGHQITRKDGKFWMKRTHCLCCNNSMMSVNSITCVSCHLKCICETISGD